MSEKRVVFINGRGAVVSDWQALQKLVPNSKSVPLDMAVNMKIYKFDFTYKNLAALQWAKFWVKKGDKRAQEIGTFVPCVSIRPENNVSVKRARKEFFAEKAHNEKCLKKKERMIGGAFNHSLF